MASGLFAARLGLLAWLLIAAVFYGLTFRFADAGGTYAWGPAAWPRAVLALMATAAIANYLANRPVAGGTGDTGTARRRLAYGEILSAAGMIALPIGYVLLIPRAGFYISTLVFLPTYMVQMGERRWLLVAGVTLLLFVMVNLVFTRVFYVALPTGTWPGFYDVSSWFVAGIRT